MGTVHQACTAVHGTIEAWAAWAEIQDLGDLFGGVGTRDGMGAPEPGPGTERSLAASSPKATASGLKAWTRSATSLF